jgi:hypothetical protein
MRKVNRIEVVKKNLMRFDETLYFPISTTQYADITALPVKLLMNETALKQQTPWQDRRIRHPQLSHISGS